MLDSLFTQPLSKFSLVYLLVSHPPLHTSYISLHNHCLIFAAHCNLFCCRTEIMSSIRSLSLSSLLATLSFTLTSHIHLTILISARWSATLFSFHRQHILRCTQLLYSLPFSNQSVKRSKNHGAYFHDCISGDLFVRWLSNTFCECAQHRTAP